MNVLNGWSREDQRNGCFPHRTAWQDIGRRFDLDTTQLTVGRGSGNDMVLNDPMVSRYHAVVTPGQWALVTIWAVPTRCDQRSVCEPNCERVFTGIWSSSVRPLSSESRRCRATVKSPARFAGFHAVRRASGEFDSPTRRRLATAVNTPGTRHPPNGQIRSPRCRSCHRPHRAVGSAIVRGRTRNSDDRTVGWPGSPGETGMFSPPPPPPSAMAATMIRPVRHRRCRVGAHRRRHRLPRTPHKPPQMVAPAGDMQARAAPTVARAGTDQDSGATAQVRDALTAVAM
jgi:hypothetical protein